MARRQTIASTVALGLALSGFGGVSCTADTWAWYRENQRVPLMRFDFENGFRRGTDLSGGRVGMTQDGVGIARRVGGFLFELGLSELAERQIKSLADTPDVRDVLDRGDVVVFYVNRVEQKGGEDGETITVQDAAREIGSGQDLSEALDKYVIQTSPPDGAAGLSAPRPNADMFSGSNSSVYFVVSRNSNGTLAIAKQYNYGLPSRSSALARQKFRDLARSGWTPFKSAFPSGHLVEPLGKPVGTGGAGPRAGDRPGRGESPGIEREHRSGDSRGGEAPATPPGPTPGRTPDAPGAPAKPAPPSKPDDGGGRPGPVIRGPA
jgi:hypothetical protein